VQQVGIELL